MNPFVLLADEELKPHGQALELLEELDFLGQMWILMKPKPPLTRSDLMLCSTMRGLEMEGKTPVTVSQLAKYMRMSVPGASQKVSALEKSGYLTRIADDKDRRVVTIELSEQGRKLTRDTMLDFLRRLQRALQHMDEADRIGLIKGLGAFNEALKLMQEEDKNGC